MNLSSHRRAYTHQQPANLKLLQRPKPNHRYCNVLTAAVKVGMNTFMAENPVKFRREEETHQQRLCNEQANVTRVEISYFGWPDGVG
jgi:translation initiation factor RLI1